MRFRRQEFEDLCKAADVLTKMHTAADVDNLATLFTIGQKIVEILNEEYEYSDEVPDGEFE